ncbi:Uncharacterised protein [uncultured archaeon]|nr:Uncharacterised protein [uncultured archaeon]
MGVIQNFATKQGWFPNHAKNLFLKGKLSSEQLITRLSNRRDLAERAKYFAGVADSIKSAAKKEPSANKKAAYFELVYELRFHSSAAFLQLAKIDKSYAFSYKESSRDQREQALNDCPNHPNAVRDAQLLVNEFKVLAENSGSVSNIHEPSAKEMFHALLRRSAYYEQASAIVLKFPALSSNGNVETVQAYYLVMETLLSSTYSVYFGNVDLANAQKAFSDLGSKLRQLKTSAMVPA